MNCTFATLVSILLPVVAAAAPKVVHHTLGAPKGTSRAVSVTGATLIHTAQLLPVDDDGKLVGEGNLGQQLDAVFGYLDRIIALERLEINDRLGPVKLNLYVAADEHIPAVFAYLEKRAANAAAAPAVTIVVGQPPLTGALVALDAVAPGSVAEWMRLFVPNKPGPVRGPATFAVLPIGPSFYVAGQAEKGATPAEAARKTLESLRATLKFLGLTDADVVQAKAFLVEPQKNAAAVTKEFITHFGERKVPPLVFVEWNSNQPIEIELIAAAKPPKRPHSDELEFLTPPGVTASPVYSRVTRVHSPTTIYVGGLLSEKAGDGAVQVADVFAQLGKTVDATGSDLHHLAKATYYVSTNDASAKLNELRPRYYDPRRPPSASKAMTPGVGHKDRGLLLDMIAVPSTIKKEGPAESGHALTAEEAAKGWLSLFDGKTDTGWSKSDVDAEAGVLTGGTTTTTFPPSEIRGEAVSGGTILAGDREYLIQPGAFRVAATTRRSTIVLSEKLALKSIALRPLNLKSIQPGPDLAGWKRIDRDKLAPEKRPVWKATNGILEAVGGPGALEHPQLFGDVLIQVEVRSRNRHANGGIFFRSIPGDFMNGYEAQIHSACEGGDPSKPWEYATGGLDDRQNARRLVSRDFQPFVMTIIADGTRIATWVNGYQTVEWNDTRPRDDNPRRGRRLEAGTIQLQAHDPATDLEFRKIAVVELK